MPFELNTVKCRVFDLSKIRKISVYVVYVIISLKKIIDLKKNHAFQALIDI